MKNIFALIVILFCAQESWAQKNKIPSAFQYVKQDTSIAATKDEVVQLARKMKESAYKTIKGKDKIDLDKILKLLENSDSVKRGKASYSLSSAAMMMMAASQNKEITIVLCTAPVELFPDHPLIVSNFTALLRGLDSIKVSLPMLLYAKNLDPSAPVILTNLGNTLLELLDDRKAEVFFKRALQIDNHYRDARSSLVLVYLKRKEYGNAYAELMKGVEEVTYTSSTKQQLDVAERDPGRQQQASSSSQTPPPPSGPQSPPSSGSQGNGTPDQLKLPPFPDWTDLQAFFAAKGIKKWDDEVSVGVRSSSDKMMEDAKKKASAIRNLAKSNAHLSLDDQLRALNPPLAKIFERNQYAMEVMQQYIDDRFDKIDKTRNDADKKSGEKYKKGSEAYSAAYEIKSKAITDQIEAASNDNMDAKERAALGQKISEEEAAKIGESAGKVFTLGQEQAKLMTKYFCDMQRLTEDWFGEWKNSARIHHNKTNDLLMEYWVYCEQYLNGVYSTDYDLLNHTRMFYVYTKLSGLSSVYAFMPLAFMAGTLGCPDIPPAPPATSDEMETDVPEEKGPPCPWENNKKLKVGAGPCSVALDCESIEVECLAFVGAAVKWSKDRTITVTPEIGWEWQTGIASGPLSLGLKASVKAGASFTFDRDGQPLDKEFGKLTFEGGVSAGAGGGGVGVNANTTIDAVAGTKYDLQYELSATH